MRVFWNNEGTSDKIWGVTTSDGRSVTFWGRRTRELTYKIVPDSDIAKLIRKKVNDRGYNEVSQETLEELDPTFTERFRDGLVLATITDGFHGIRNNNNPTQLSMDD